MNFVRTNHKEEAEAALRKENLLEEDSDAV